MNTVTDTIKLSSVSKSQEIILKIINELPEYVKLINLAIKNM